MKKFRLRDYLPVLIMVLCAAIFGVLLAAGVMDLDTVPQLVADRPVLAVLVVLGGGGAFAYIKFIRPKQASKVSADPDDYDFADEEEYINEDEPEPEEEMEDTK